MCRDYSQQCKTLEKEKIDLLIINKIYYSKRLKGILRVLNMQRTGIYCYCFVAIRRVNTARYLVASNVIQFVENYGFVF